MFGLGSIIGGLGALAGISAQQGAQRDARNARNEMVSQSNQASVGEREKAAMLMDWLKQRMALVESARAQGAYDADTLISRYEQTATRNAERDLSNMAGGFATLGYRPGDSEPGARMQAAYRQNATQRERDVEDLRRNAPMMYAQAHDAAMGGLLPLAANLEGAAANRLAGLNASLYNDAQSRSDAGLAGLLNVAMPFLNELGQSKTSNSPDSIPYRAPKVKMGGKGYVTPYLGIGNNYA